MLKWNLKFTEIEDGWLTHDTWVDFMKFQLDHDEKLTGDEIVAVADAMVKAGAVAMIKVADAHKDDRKADPITVPMDEVYGNHLEFEVIQEEDGTYTAVQHVAGNTPNVLYTGFKTRADAERFVMNQPDPADWEEGK